MAHVNLAADTHPAFSQMRSGQPQRTPVPSQDHHRGRKTNGMPFKTAPTVSSRVMTTSCRPVMPTFTFSSGSVIAPLIGAAYSNVAPHDPQI